MRIFVTGGSRSGKSSWAERRAQEAGLPVTYVATGPRPSADDPEWAERIAAHQARRPAGWRTVETLDVGPHLGEGAVLVDCLTLWLTGVMSECDVWGAPRGSAPWTRLAARVDELVDEWRRASGLVVVVTNEVGDGVVPEHRSGRQFRDEMGALNARVAAESDEAWLLTAGLPLRLR